MATVAIQNIRMMERQQLLLDATKSLSQSLSIDDVLSTCFRFMEKTTSSGDIGIHLYNEKERVLSPYHLSSTSHFTEEEWKGKHKQEIVISIDNDLLFHEVVTQKKAVAIEDVFADPRPNHNACKSFRIKSLLVVPLVAKGHVFGAIAIPSIDVQKKFTDNEIEICQSIGDVTATALSNAYYAENLDSSVKERTVELQQANFKLEELVKELQFLNDLKNDFISSLSHELRTPITAIKGSIDILKRKILGELNTAQFELIETSNKATSRLLNQVNELLDFAKLESGKFELNRVETDIHQTIEEAVGIMEPLIDKKKQNLVIETDVKSPLYMDRQRILQVLLNLLSNANKFTAPGGNIKIKSYLKADSLFVEVHDTGMGIPMDYQKNIFMKFYQANNQLNGTGLGLAISKQLIELHKGRIWFDSIEGVGSSFKFTLPINGMGNPDESD
jgi:signal transduction histidine kinase